MFSKNEGFTALFFCVLCAFLRILGCKIAFLWGGPVAVINQVSVNEHANLVLTYLTDIDDPEYVTKVLDCFEYVSLDNAKFFEKAQEFHGNQGRYPDVDYLQAHGFTDRSSEKWSLDIADEFLYHLRSVKVQQQAIEGLSAGKFDEAKDIISELEPLEEQLEEGDFGIEDAEAAYDDLLKMPAGCKLGVPEIDNVIKGLSYGTMSVFAAPAGGGKTTFLLSSLYYACFKSGYKFVVLSMEMQKRDVWFSLLSRHAVELNEDLPAESIKKGLLTDAQRTVLSDVVKNWQENCRGQIHVLTPGDFPDFSKETFRRVLQQYEDIDGVAVDYMQLMRYYTPAGENMQEFLNTLVSFFSVLSRTYIQKGENEDENKSGLIVILLSQINREGMRRLGKTRIGELSMLAELNSFRAGCVCCNCGIFGYIDTSRETDRVTSGQE